MLISRQKIHGKFNVAVSFPKWMCYDEHEILLVVIGMKGRYI